MEDFLAPLIPIAFFAMIAAIVIVPRYFRAQERQKMAETLRAAIEKGQPLPGEVVDAITSDVKTPPSPQRDLRVGIVWLGVALGFAAMGIAVGFQEPDATFPLIGVACFPGFIGLAFIVMGLLNRERK